MTNTFAFSGVGYSGGDLDFVSDSLDKAAAGSSLEDLSARAVEIGVSTEVVAEAVRYASLFPASEAVDKLESAFLDRRDRVSKRALKAAVRLMCSESRQVDGLFVCRRDGRLVAWDTLKIEVAVRMAFISCGVPSSPAVDVAESVRDAVLALGRKVVGIEEVQDVVSYTLMRLGHYKVAAHYVVYRAARATGRAEAPSVPEQQDSFIIVSDSDGKTSLWDGQELNTLIALAMQGLDLQDSPSFVEKELRRSFTATMSRQNLERLILMNARTLVERDAAYALFAGRLATFFLYGETLGWSAAVHSLEDAAAMHVASFRPYIERGVEIGRLSPELLKFDLDRLSSAFVPARDLDFDFLGTQTLYDRYFIVDKTSSTHRRIENHQFFWMRVAMGIALAEKDSDREEFAIRLFNLYTTRRFCSSTPTLFNSGTLHSQLSSCYLYKVDDSIESIMQRGIAENAYLSKWAGGLGGSWTAVRGTGAHICGTNGESQGVIPFLKIHNDQLVAVNQGGKRRGSGCAYLEIWHNDIEDFLELRKNTGDDRRRTHDLNTAIWVPDLFMKRMEARQDWTLFRSNEVPDLHDLYGSAFETRYAEYEKMAAEGKIFGRSIPAIELWKRMLKALFETGHPWITFKDPCNLRSPQDHAGVIHSSNLCTEITLNTSQYETAVCNLGSIVLENHIKDDGSVDMDLLEDTVRTAVRALDNVIDINFYPTEAARTANMRHRPVGLGVMGLQKALHKKRLPFASEAAVEFNDVFMEAIAYYAYQASSDLASERGTYPSYKGSKWDRGILPQDTLDTLESERGRIIEVPRGGLLDWSPVRKKIAAQGMRNSNVIAIAPTATISNIMGSTPCIEPNYKNLYVKSNLGGNFTVLVPELVQDLKAMGLWSPEMLNSLKISGGELSKIQGIPEGLACQHMTAFDIPYIYIINAAARRQKWIDQSQSLNLFLPIPDLKTLSFMYRKAWHAGIKTTYYLRSLAASSIEGPTSQQKKALRGVVAGNTQQNYTEEQRAACSIEAMQNGGTCEACQ